MRNACMNVCMCACMRVCMSVHNCMCVYVCVYVFGYLCAFIHISQDVILTILLVFFLEFLWFCGLYSNDSDLYCLLHHWIVVCSGFRQKYKAKKKSSQWGRRLAEFQSNSRSWLHATDVNMSCNWRLIKRLPSNSECFQTTVIVFS